MDPCKPLIWLLLIFMRQLWVVVAESPSGKVDVVFNSTAKEYRDKRPLLKNTKIYIHMECVSPQNINIEVSWTLTEYRCWIIDGMYDENLPDAQINQNFTQDLPKITKSQVIVADCPLENHAVNIPLAINGDGIHLDQNNAADKTAVAVGDSVAHKNKETQLLASPNQQLIYTTSDDDIYELVLGVSTKDGKGDFSARAHIEFLGPHGYISARDWPLLPFYGVMCFVYVIYGLVWLIVSFMQWRDLLRIQFWIGGVILLGMLEKAFFYASYHSLNTTGESVPGSEMPAEFVSCAKRTLARMLVIIMSLGFGIVKPRLGPMLHRVVGVGALYFILACVESYLRVTHVRPDERNELLVASIPLAVLDTGICWWIFTSLVQTTRTLRLRRNMVKLSLYRHFTNTLIFAVIASIIFMLFAMRLRKSENCTPGWRDIWLDVAFWHILFSVLLLVIMILWRPTNNNQRYAFTPLLDNPEDEDEDEEDQFVADAYGVKIRTSQMNGGKRTPPSSQRGNATTTTEDEDLRWVEENIPSSMAEPTLPILDSDEEIINTKFEVSKMQ